MKEFKYPFLMLRAALYNIVATCANNQLKCGDRYFFQELICSSNKLWLQQPISLNCSDSNDIVATKVWQMWQHEHFGWTFFI